MEFEFEKPLQPIRDEIAKLEAKRLKGDSGASAKIATLQRRLAVETASLYKALTPWDTVQVARHPGRPTIMQYATRMCDELSSCMATASSATIRRWSADSPASATAASCSSAIARA